MRRVRPFTIDTPPSHCPCGARFPRAPHFCKFAGSPPAVQAWIVGKENRRPTKSFQIPKKRRPFITNSVAKEIHHPSKQPFQMPKKPPSSRANSGAEENRRPPEPIQAPGKFTTPKLQRKLPGAPIRPAPNGTLPTPDRFHPAKPFHDNGAALPIRKAAPFTVGGGQPACTGRRKTGLLRRNKIPHGLRRRGILHRWTHFFARYLRISMAHATRMTRPLMM